MGGRQFVQTVQGGLTPRYVYSVADGDHPSSVLLAGTTFFDGDEARRIVRAASSVVAAGVRPHETVSIETDTELVDIEFEPIHASWTNRLIPETRRGEYFQILVSGYGTIDVPVMAEPYDVRTAGAWKWLDEPWMFEAPSSSKVATNLAALRGEPITEAARWDDDYFEAFAGSGPATPRDDVRFVGFPPLVGVDEGLSTLASLPVGAAVVRSGLAQPWEPWRSSGRR